MKLFIFWPWVSNSKCYFLFFNSGLVTQSAAFFQLRISNSNTKEKKFNLRVSNSKFNLIFYKVELVTRKKNLYKHFRVSNSKCDLILRNLVSKFDFVTREFRTSTKKTLHSMLNFYVMLLSKHFAAEDFWYTDLMLYLNSF